MKPVLSASVVYVHEVGDLLGAVWHFLGQGVFLRLVASSSRLVGVNVLEANCILLAISCLGNGLAGSRMRCIPGKDASEVSVGAHCRLIDARARAWGDRAPGHMSEALSKQGTK